MPSRSQRHLREVHGVDSGGRVNTKIFQMLAAPFIEENVAQLSRIVNESATVTPGSYTKSASYSYQWYGDGVALDGETGTTLDTTFLDDGMLITVLETADSDDSDEMIKVASNTRVIAHNPSPNELTFEVPLGESSDGSPLFLLIAGGPSPHGFTARLSLNVFGSVTDQVQFTKTVPKSATAEDATNVLLAAAAVRDVAGLTITGVTGTITFTPDDDTVHFQMNIDVF